MKTSVKTNNNGVTAVVTKASASYLYMSASTAVIVVATFRIETPMEIKSLSCKQSKQIME